MILYYGVTSYHMLCCILHKMTRHPEEQAELYLSDTHPECHRLIGSIRESGIFAEAELFPDKGRMLPYKKEYGQHKSEETLDRLIQDLCRKTEKDFPFNPDEITEYNICGDQYSLGIWLIHHQKTYNFFEEGCGVYTRKHLLLENLARLNPFQYDMAEKCRCMGDYEGIIKKYIEFSSQEGEFDRENCEDFSVKNILADMSEQEMAQVKKVFQVPEVSAGKEASAVLLLTQQFVNMGFLTVNQEKELYDLMLDYFAPEGTLYVKPHPSDWQGLYADWYPEAVILPRFMPSELLPYSRDGKFAAGVTVSSTSIFGLEPYMKEIVCLDSSLEDHYENINWYYAVGQILSQGVLEAAELRYEGSCPRLFQAMTPAIPKGGSRTILVTAERGEKSEADLVIYMNEDGRNQIPEWMFEKPECLWPAAICVTDTENGFKGFHYLYIYSEERELLDALKKTEVKKQLEYSKKEVSMTPEKYQAQCRALEGMLKAANQRIEVLLKEKEELEWQLKQK